MFVQSKANSILENNLGFRLQGTFWWQNKFNSFNLLVVSDWHITWALSVDAMTFIIYHLLSQGCRREALSFVPYCCPIYCLDCMEAA